MSSVGANKMLMLAALREVGSQDYLIEFVRFKTRNDLYNKGFIPSNDISNYIKYAIDRVVNQIPYLKAEFEVVLDTFIPRKSTRYFKDIKKELLAPITITKEIAIATLEEHNKDVLSKMNKKAYEAEKDFFEHPERRYKHLEKFVRTTPSYYFGGITIPEKREEIINKNFYEVDIDPNILNSLYIDDYLGALEVIKEELIIELWSEIDFCIKHAPQSSAVIEQEHTPLVSKKELSAPTLVNSTPIFKPEIKEQLINILKDHFNKSDIPQLEQLIQTSEDVTSPLIFKDTGNRLANAFKQLKEWDFITGCQKQELEQWIARNFVFLHRKEVKEFKLRYLNDVISSTKDKCMNPLFKIRKNSTGEAFISKS